MNLFGRYLKLQFKRVSKAYVWILSITFVLLAIVAAIGYAVLLDKKNDESFQRVSIGIVGDQEDKLLNMAISLLSEADSSRFTIDFLEYESDEEALHDMEKRKIESYVVIPEGFAESLINGENKKLDYVMFKRGATMSSLLTREVIDVISNYIVETQAGVSAMCAYARNQEYSTSEVTALDYDMSLEYMNLIIRREQFTDVIEVGLGGKLSFIGYYVSAFTIFFLLCFGIACCPIRVKNNRALDKFLYSKRYGVICQVMGEYIPYLIVSVITLLIPYAAAGVLSNYMEFGVPELEYLLMSDYFLLPIRLLPAIFVITALQFFLYEMVSGVINSVLLQFVVSVTLGYLSGCFYPIYFLPSMVQRLSTFLPTGIALTYYNDILSADFDIQQLFLCFLYGLGLLGVSMLVRRIQISKLEGGL